MEQLIDMLALLKEVSRISLVANFSRKLEGNNGRNFARKFAANYREKRIIARKFAAKYHAQRNIAENSFRVNFRRKAPKSQEIRRNSFALLLHNTVCDEFLFY